MEVLRLVEEKPGVRFAAVERAWDGGTVLCIGGGPSASPERVASCKGRWPAIVINNSFLLAPWAKLHYFADTRWWKWYATDGTATLGFPAEEVRARYEAFTGQKVTVESTAKHIKDPRVLALRILGQTKLSADPRGIHSGSNSGYQVINIAWLAGAKRIVLLGYDMSFPGGRSHNHAGHPMKQSEATYRRWGKNFGSMAEQLESTGTEVVNCSEGRGIEAFPFRALESVLAD